ncbi:MAG: LPS assembly protein LptD [Aestuariibacter sp.]|nr:LPS biosynthesis protein [Alteromonadaceae bacterium]MCP3862332.1 LPS assembly protein LptD [Aestuariibacter sp.]MCP4236246.1 LPS assembly protein LptD [Aestuariibacter sp.]MCP4525907.1 LPS assembly protein LptD [Aestuariibacter sp.]MCP4947870.1 LPS assembly protein LptD [Aestuariibacter sp.]
MSDSAEVLENQLASFAGNVDITTDSAVIHAEKAEVSDNGKSVSATGNVTYSDRQLSVSSDGLSVSSQTQTLNMQNTVYQLTGFVGHGAAEEIDISADDGISLKEVSFTTCPLGQEDWRLVASEISIEQGETMGEARHTRFYVGDVPVLYLPYFAFPVSNQRQSGLLFPLISSSTSTGIDYEQPYYWNIAPNYDMTISPRLMSNRGVQLKTEFRYLTENAKGNLFLEYLPNDTKLSSDDSRYFYRYQHQGTLGDSWMLNADLNGISDNNYIVDLGSDFYNRSDTTINRTLGVEYFSNHVDFSLYVRDFDTIGDYEDIYRALPEAKIQLRQPLGDMLALTVDSELAYFDNAQENNPTALRWHVAPTLSLPYQRYWGEMTAELTVLNTYYHQREIEGTQLEEEVNRTLTRGRLFSSLYLERNDNLLGNNMTVTLEPKIQYLYTSYEDQSNIGLYDTTALLNDVNGLFRGQEFTGLDRINDNNQITLGVTSRVIDDANREQFVVSLGQIFYLADTRITATTDDRNRSALAAELDWRFDDNWFVHSTVQIATDNDKVERSSMVLEYRRDNESLVQMSHRFVRDLSGETIDQLGISASWPIAKNWHWVGRSYRDLERDRSIENYFGVQYESCCWAVRLVAQRSLSNRYDALGQQNTNEFDSSIGLQFIFKGIGSARSNRDMLEDGMFGYRQPYVLN